jgi:hypothetical protein
MFRRMDESASPKLPTTQARVRARALDEALVADIEGGIHRSFPISRDIFDESMAALRQVHKAIMPAIEQLDETRLISALVAATNDLEPAQAKRLIMGTSALVNSGRGIGLRRVDQPPQTVTPGTSRDPKPPIEVEPGVNLTDAQLDQLGEEMARELADAPGTLLHVFRLFEREYVTPQRQRLIRGLLLTAATSTFEALLGTLIEAFYSARPERLGDEPKFSLRDLQGFDTLDDARDEAIGRRVESILHADIGQWSKWLEQNTGLHMENLTIDYPTLFENFQRRHIVLHAGEKVSRLYRRRLLEVGQEPPPLGTRLAVDKHYLERAFDELQTLGSLITVGIWSKAAPNEETVALHGLYLESYDLMLEGRWPAVEKICAVGKRPGVQDESARQVFRVNELLAVKRQHGLDQIKEDIEGWDTSALGTRFGVAHKALLDDLDGLFATADELLATNQISVEELLEWPLLREMREDPRFSMLVNGYALDEDEGPRNSSTEQASPGEVEGTGSA